VIGADGDPGAIGVEVCWADAAQMVRMPLRLRAGATVADAIEASGLRARIDAAAGPIGIAIHGRAATPAERLHDGDRVELLQPLRIDPKQARRLRAQKRAR